VSESKAASDQANNLDISQVPNEDAEALANAIEKFYSNDTYIKSQLSYTWERVHMMLDGQQWLVYEGNRGAGGIWKPIKVSKENEYIPRPVTNYMFDAYQTLKSYMLKSKPRSTVRPNSSSHKDKTAAKIAQLVLEANYERLKEEYNYEYAVSCLVTYGTVFKKDFWDPTSATTARVPAVSEQPVTDPVTGEVRGTELRPVTDEFGQPVYEEINIGDVNTQVIEPYRLCLDPLASDLHNARWVMEYSVQTLDWIKATYGKDPAQAPGYTGRAEEVKEESTLNNSLRRWYNLKTSSGVKTAGQFSTRGGGTDAMITNAAIVKEYYERPSSLYPRGRKVVVANGITLYAGDSTSAGETMGDWHPYSECRWELMPGRFWGKGPLEDGAEIQKRINSIDAVIILTRKTMAIPQKLIPLGVGVEAGSWTGRPGQNVFYRDNGSGLKPETIPAASVDGSVFREREQAVQDFKQTTGAMDILKGDRPPGVTAASALNMLFEVGTGKLFPMLDRYKAFIESSQKKQLKLIAKYYREPREEFIRLLKSKNVDLAEEEINNFIGEDLQDNCNVIIEAGSNTPKLQAAQQAALLEIANTGALQLDLPANRSEFLTRLGIVGFDSDVGPDTKRAEWENDLLDNIMSAPEKMPVVLDADDDEIHLEVHRRRQKSPAYMSLPFEVQQAYDQHIMEHEAKQSMDMQNQAIQAAMSGLPPEQAQEPSSLAPQELTQSGKGVSQGMKNSLFSDAIKPGDRT